MARYRKQCVHGESAYIVLPDHKSYCRECKLESRRRGQWRIHRHEQALKHGRDPSAFEPMTAERRFWGRVEWSEGCWMWQGPAHAHGGYGRYSKWWAHRYAYELAVGPIPEGLVIDHLCRNRMCVNPAHLEPVEQSVNHLRGFSASNVNAYKTSCIRGHPFDASNTGRTPEGYRRCRACNAETKRRAAKKALESAA